MASTAGNDDRVQLEERVRVLGERVKTLKMSKDPAVTQETDQAVAELKELKKRLAELAESDAAKKFELKTPKGTRDFGPAEMAVRERAFGIITNVFKRHGAVTIDTPVFELKDVLTGKYGEDSKLIYDLKDQGGELCALRYDLTVPFARFLAMNTNIKQIKRYQIGKVYRRDNPGKGRFREFYQCDLDIAGVYDRMVPDSEILRIMAEVLTELDVGKFLIKVNHRKILDGVFEVCGVPEDKFRAICSAVDKLDKSPWEEVRKEMTEEKGLDGATADQIGNYVRRKGQRELLEVLLQDPKLMANERAKTGLEDIALLLEYLDAMDVLKHVSFDCSLARGLDYYTGVIYEAVLVGADLGSISGGGRYDNLVGMFEGKSKQTPCVGFSVGIERVFTILEARAKENPDIARVTDLHALIVPVGDVDIKERMKLASELWSSNIRVDFSHKRKVKPLDEFQRCEKNSIPLALIIGDEEVKQGIVKIKDMREGEKDKGTPVPRTQISQEIQRRLKPMAPQ